MTSPKPLAGVRVLSLAQQLPGPYCGLLLGDMGADVVMVEQIPTGDPARAFPALFDMVNRGKDSVALDLKNERGLRAFKRMVERADVVLEGFRPGVAERLGVDAESLRQVRPDLVYCSISGYGQDGPVRLLPGHDLSYQARAGAVHVMNEHGPREPNLPVADLSSAMFAALAVVAALFERDRGPGSGRFVDISMTESVLSWNSIAIAFATAASGPSLMGNEREPAYGVFRTLDGWITLSIAHEQHFWSSLCKELDEPEFADLSGPERRARSAELRNWLEGRLISEPSASWVEKLGAAGVPVGPVNTPEQTLTDPLFELRQSFQTIDGHTFVRPPLRFDGQPVTIRGGPPRVGRDTERHLREAGVTGTELELLRSEGAVLE